MKHFLILFFLYIFLFISPTYADDYRYDTTQEYIFARYMKDKESVMDERNVMRLTCIIDNTTKQIIEYRLLIGYNSADRVIINKGTKIVFTLFNNKKITLYSINDITEKDNIKYKEQIKQRYKCYISYSLSIEDLNLMLKEKVFEFKQYIFEGKFEHYGVRNIGHWLFNEVLQKCFDDLGRNYQYQPRKKKEKSNVKKKPSTDVDRLFKEGKISYLENDSLIVTDENIKFDIKWIEQ